MGKVKQTLIEMLDDMEDDPPVFNPNKNPVYAIPLSELVNLWRARFGDTWVDVSEIADEFWSAASMRLHQNKMMEEINHRTDTTPWSRLKEDA
jgi:hypothetical protein